MDDMVTAATMLEDSADVIDLNFGCPAPKVTNICAGAALMGEPKKLVSMVENIVDAVNIPVTAKMRLGTGQGPTMLSISVNHWNVWVRNDCASMDVHSVNDIPELLIGKQSKLRSMLLTFLSLQMETLQMHKVLSDVWN